MASPDIDELGRRLGIVWRDPETIRQAFVHSSYYNENPSLVSGHNERLEVYGDAVIGIVVSRLLFDRFPEEDEGLLTPHRAALAGMALELGLDRCLLLGRGETDAGGATRPSLLAAAFEALAGALSLSEGTEVTRQVLGGLFEKRLAALADEAGPPKSSKSRLQEWTQRHRATKPVYRLVATSGPPHAQRFRVAVVIDGTVVADGRGSSRQRAEEQAARAALESLPELAADLAAPDDVAASAQ